MPEGVQTVQRAAPALNAALLPAPGNRFLPGSPKQLLEVENDSSGNTQVVLRQVIAAGSFRKMGQ